ncbi:MAG: DUF4373 domain-containing protein [Tannerellaceae bacterium]|jgi:hypothetical protein|nr:DUF4373 domain-containing protein [Tannerellaceae bacterium]
MKKGTYYFSHDFNARNDEKVVAIRMKYGMEGYGIYFALLELLGEGTDYIRVKDYNIIAFDLRVDSSKVKSIVEDFGLFAFADDGKCFYSESFTDRMKPLDNMRKQRQIAGKKSAEKRSKSDEFNDRSTTVEDTSNDRCQNFQQRKEKKRREYIPPLPPLEGAGDVIVEKTWRDDFEMYLTDLRKAYEVIVNDTAYITERAKYHPNLNIKISLEKACKDFWATEAGWIHKKKSKATEINWKSTLTKALDQKCNHVYLKKGETNGQQEEKTVYV